MDLTRTRLRNFDVTWASYAFGAVDKVTPDVKLVLSPLSVGSVGRAVLGHRIVGVEGAVVVMAREIDLTFFQKMLPWYSAGSIALNPATINKDLYDYAGLLTLHPQDVDATTQDINLLKAVPQIKHMDRDGVKDDAVQVTFTFYPDRTQLPTLVYGYLGTAP
jgi:hypothetical protein